MTLVLVVWYLIVLTNHIMKQVGELQDTSFQPLFVDEHVTVKMIQVCPQQCM